MVNSNTETNGIWIFAELQQNKLANVSLELLGKAKEFTQKQGSKLTALLLGNEVKDLAQELIYYGADRVIMLDSPVLAEYKTRTYAQAIAGLAKDEKPSIMLFGATSLGRDLAPRVMAKLETGLTADCLDLDLDENGVLVQTKPSYGGNIMCKIVCPENRPQMATVRPKVFSVPMRDEKRTGEIVCPNIAIEDDIYMSFVSRIQAEIEGPNIEEAEIIVAGGRGLETEENFKLIEELARVLGGCIGVSRPLVDAGWAPHYLQIGQSGKTVKPKLIITVGISGAVQFSVGMQKADCIVAINKDPDAPIFSIANYGIVGKTEDVLPVLIKKFRQELGKA